ncbi:MAG TPA: L-seryl-tRNA(Sec) selenium transferase [Candidatus Polarisedimenticolaceae bacterium]|nr:L-seryl-tRNA(Sec) selenium transferase [Candidatus Polarisedimenticolaceae bacterium]
MQSDLRLIPAVGNLLAHQAFSAVLEEAGAPLTTALIREDLEAVRAGVEGGTLGAGALSAQVAPEAVATRVAAAARRLLVPRPRRVINATGVIAHTNLGRAVLSREAAIAVAEAAAGYLDLEYDLRRGGRGRRMTHLTPLLAHLFPGAAALVVNNNAAAVLLALQALARGREVVVSRGELVEIGGGFRVPEILAASGARLREVGTTNRTRLQDYRAAAGPKTAALLKVHPSNFHQVGFTESVSVGELAPLARETGLPLLVDWGSGDLVDLTPFGIRDERPVAAILEDGADLVTFSGDKLLGGPQAGFLVGRPELVERAAKSPLARALRVDRVTLAALHATLSAYVRGRAFQEVPTLRMLALTEEEVGLRAARVRDALPREADLTIVSGVSRPGGGASPAGERPTRLLSLQAKLEKRLREGEPPIVGRVHEGRLLLDLRTVLPGEDAEVLRRLRELL